ncbi:hypothetical protein C8R45DRAFT_1087847 [Mycena sanguinolenta]|nr:hypothetical protein C8R45DRAFT_1087847 [Mycena sanguinolenta]
MPTNPTPKLSTHAPRNPSKPTQQPRRRATDGTRSTQDLRAMATKEMNERLQDDIDDFHEYRIQKVTELANKYQKDESYFLKVLSNQSQYATSRDMTLANAIKHDLSLKAKDRSESKSAIEINKDLGDGEYKRIKASLTKEEEERLFAQLRAHCELKAKGIHATNRSAAADTVQNANRMGDMIRNLYERTGVRGLAMFMRGNPDDPNVPHFVDSDKARLFFRQTFNMDMLDVLRKFEQWSCNRDAGLKDCTDLDFLRSEIARLLAEGLCKIKNNKTLEMDYVNYRLRIVYKLGVMLAGWPEWVDIGDGTIHWVVMTKSQHNEVAREIEELRKKGLLKSRKERANKGKKHGSYKKKGTADEEDAGHPSCEEPCSSTLNVAPAVASTTAPTSSPSRVAADATAVNPIATNTAQAAAPASNPVLIVADVAVAATPAANLAHIAADVAVTAAPAPASNPALVVTDITVAATPAANPAYIAADVAVTAVHVTAVAAPVNALPLDVLFTPKELALFGGDPVNFNYSQLDFSGLDLSNVSPLIPDNPAPFPDLLLNTSNPDVSTGGGSHAMALHVPQTTAIGSTATFGVFSANGNGGGGGSRKTARI